MPVSKVRSNRKSNPKKLSKKDVQTINAAYETKFAEYSEMSIDELISLKDSKMVKGTYLIALTEAIKMNSPVEKLELTPQA